MDILDLVALMQKYAEENPEILEFRKLKSTIEEGGTTYRIKPKGTFLENIYFEVTDGYKEQGNQKVRLDWGIIERGILSSAVNYSISNDEIEKRLYEWKASIEKIIKYNKYLNNLVVKDFFCIQNEIVLENLKDKKEIYFLGENGDGKTLILQAILIALKWDFIEDFSKSEFTGKVNDIVRKAGSKLNIKAIDSKGFEYSFFQDKIAIKGFLQNIFAYGVHRSRSSNKGEEQYGFMTLFDDSQYLRSPTDWLLKIKLDETEESYQGIKLTNAVEILEHLLADNVKIKINGSKVKFIERGFEVDFNELSEGYKSVMTWVADLVSRLAENQPEVKKLQDYQGIVLVDEISLHLHPKWEYELVRKLRGWFPNIQFIMTTHSPVTVLGASEEAVFYRVYKENGITHVSEPYSSESIKNLMANGVLTSPLFDLDSAAMRIAEDENIDTSDDFTYTLIHRQIAEQVKKLKNEGKVYISQEMLNQMVAKAIEKHKKAS